MEYKPHMLWSICHTGVNIFRENICHCQFLLAPHRFEHQMWVRLPSQHVEVFLSELGTAKSCQSSFSKHTLCLFDAMEHEPLDQPFIDHQHEPFTFYKPGDFQFFNTMSLHTAWRRFSATHSVQVDCGLDVSGPCVSFEAKS